MTDRARTLLQSRGAMTAQALADAVGWNSSPYILATNAGAKVSGTNEDGKNLYALPASK